MISTPKAAVKGTHGLIQLLQERGFIDLLSATLSGSQCCVASYGPLGTLFRHNILKQWWAMMVATQTNVFPVQVPFLESSQCDDLVNQKSNDYFSHIRGSLQKDCVTKYPQVLKLTNGRLPFSIASVGTCFSRTNNCAQNEEIDERKLLLGSSLETKLMLQNYIAPSKANAIQDFWLQTRLSWWKKIKLPGKKAFLPTCIQCETSVELAMASWLLDAYHERHPMTAGKKRLNSKIQQVLQLHQQLSPYQVALVSASTSSQSSSSSSSIQVELRHICDSLEKDFKKAGISVFNASNHGGSLDAHFRRNDQLGMLYTVIIDQATVSDGLVNTRSRDTQVKATSHISSLVREIVRNVNSQLE